MNERVPVLAALVAGLSLLTGAVVALFRLLPPVIGEGAPMEIVLNGVPTEEFDPWDPRFLTVVIAILSLLGLILVFFYQILQPKAGVQVRRPRGDVAPEPP